MLLGRAEECERIDRLLGEAQLGRSAVLVLRGQPGIGKTALLDYALQRAGSMSVLQVCGVESEADLPYSGLHALLRPVLGLIDAIPETQARALKTALALEEGGEADRLAAYAGTLSLLAEAADRGPLLVIVDDAHWLDRASAEALVFAARRMAGESIAMLFGAREGDPAQFHGDGLPDLMLRGIEPAAALEVLRERWGFELAGTVADNIVAAAEGNPLVLVDVPSLLTERQRAGLDPLDDPLPVSESIERAVLKSLASLDPPTRRALLLAAAGDGGTGVDQKTLAPARQAGIVHLHAGGATFRHPLVRAAVYHAATPEERQDAHRKLADLYSATQDEDRRAWHLASAASGPDEAVAAALEEAAGRAAERGGQASQARALERAAELSEDDESRARRLQAASRAAYWAGETERALQLVEEALPLVRDPLVHADVFHQRVAIAEWQGIPADEEEIEREAAVVEPLDRERAAKLLGVLVAHSFERLDTRRALDVARRRVALCVDASQEWRTRTVQDLTWALVLRGEPEEAEELIPQLLEDEETPTGLAPALMWLERYDEARSSLERELTRYQDAGNRLGASFDNTNLALLEVRLGRLDAAVAAASDAIEIAEQTGNVYLHACNLPVLARVDALRGAGEDCNARAELAKELAARVGSDSIAAEAATALGLLALGTGNPGEAIAQLEPVRELCEEREVLEPSVVLHAPDLIEAHIRDGDAAKGAARLDRFAELATGVGRRWALAAVERYRGFIAPDGEFEAHFEEALRLHDGGPGSPIERARTLLCYGERLRRARRRVDAREQLRSALQTFDRVQAHPWSERAGAELRATGESIPRRDPTAPEKLTPQELQISLLVAEGKTNRDVGAALFLSPKTIEYHLTHVYRKLDLHSRAELIRLFSGEQAPELVA